MNARTVLEGAEISRALTRISHEILEANKGISALVLLGIPTRGAVLAQRLAERIEQIEGVSVPCGSLDVTMYRDDLRLQPVRMPKPTELPVESLDGAHIVLVDDVLYSGRTVRAALDAISDYGRPETIRLATLIDRGHRQLPIRADFIGKNLPSAKSEKIRVKLVEIDGADEVTVES